MNCRYVITGTDTDVGKTVVAAGLAATLRAHYWKPIQAGLGVHEDSRIVAELGRSTVKSVLPEAYRLTTPCSPHESARIDGVQIELAKLRIPEVRGSLVIEGAGGISVPVSERLLMLDLFAEWCLPTILVARTALGTINHSLLSINALRGRGLVVAGVIFVGDTNPASEEAVTRMGAVRHLGRLPWLDPLNHDTLREAITSNIKVELLR